MSNKRYRAFFSTAVLLCVVSSLSGQQQTTPPAGVIRIDVNLVQVDAVVTDSAGKAVTNLTRDDFEILQDGQPQRITNFEFVTVKDRAAMIDALRVNFEPANVVRGVPPPLQQTPLRREDIRRTIALVVDDLALSFESVVRVRESLKKWVDNEMEAGDLVAIVRTSAGMGSLQRFTRDKQLLYSAIDLVRYQPGRIGVSSFAAATGAPPKMENPETGELVDVSIDRTVFEDEVEHAYVVGSLGAIQYVVRGLRDLPGRKSLILFSESMKFTFLEGPGPVRTYSQSNATSDDRIRRLADEANRSSVVIYAIDPRGVVNTALSAEDNLAGMSDEEIRNVAASRSQQLIESRDGMIELSQKTGGVFIRDSNDISRALTRVVDDGDGYYLLGYQPDLSTFDEGAKKQFHSIKVRVKRPGLTVRSRSGFFGKSDYDLSAGPPTKQTQIVQALASPFTSDDLRVHLTALASPAEKGSSINTLLHFDARDLSFSEAPDGSRTAEGDIVAVTFNAEGEQVDTVARGWKVTVPREDYDKVTDAGFVFAAILPVKKSGGYQLRAVVRDSGSQRIGSAMQFVEIPDVSKGRLTLSGILMGAENVPKVGDSAGRERVEGTPAVRIFRSGSTVNYAYQILNARVDVDKKPQLESQIRLFRDGQMVYASRGSALASDPQNNPKRLIATGRFQLNRIPPGNYTFQLIVEDNLRHDKYARAVQAIDFQVRE